MVARHAADGHQEEKYSDNDCCNEPTHSSSGDTALHDAKDNRRPLGGGQQ